MLIKRKPSRQLSIKFHESLSLPKKEKFTSNVNYSNPSLKDHLFIKTTCSPNMLICGVNSIVLYVFRRCQSLGCGDWYSVSCIVQFTLYTALLNVSLF